MIRTERLWKSYGSKQAVADLDLHVEPGEILGFLGPNGAGKSTTVKILTGLMEADGGNAFVAGFDVAREPLEAKRRLGFVPEAGEPCGGLRQARRIKHIDVARPVGAMRHQPRPLELGEMAGHGRAADREHRRQLANAAGAVREGLHEAPALGVAEGIEGFVGQRIRLP